MTTINAIMTNNEWILDVLGVPYGGPFGGKDAQGEVLVQVEHHGQVYRGRAVSTDSVEASAKAFLNAINRIVAVLNGEASPAGEKAES